MHGEAKAPAKVNLSLLVGSAGADGYHEIFSVFAPVDLFDKLTLDLTARPSGEGPGTLSVECETAPGEDNLVTRALRSLERATGWAIEGRVGITKAIPIGAGLGGGSSDAAAALRAGAEAIVAAGGRKPGRTCSRPWPGAWARMFPSSCDQRPRSPEGWVTCSNRCGFLPCRWFWC